MSNARNLSALGGKSRVNSSSGVPEWLSSTGWQSLAKYDYTAATFPSTTVNPSNLFATWYNTATKSQLVCVDNTTNANIWREVATAGNASRVDFFGDSSIVAFYKCDGNSLDATGNYSMTVNGFSSSSGKFAQGLYGNPAYMAIGSVPSGTAPNNASIITVSMWINSPCSGDNYLWSSGKISNGTNRRGLLLTGTSLSNSYTTEYGTITGATITPNVWAHVCVSADKVYLNGSLVSTMASYSAPTADTYGFYIGANGAYDYGYVGNETYGKPYNGSIDQVRVFNRALTASEVNALYLEAL